MNRPLWYTGNYSSPLFSPSQRDTSFGGVQWAMACYLPDGGYREIPPDKNSISLYPNPANDWLAVKGLDIPTAAWNIVDVAGRIIMTRFGEIDEPIRLPAMASGVYCLRLQFASFNPISLPFIIL
ncbi:MAG: T9SS type A sorting domain-containing protein [Edaphocola sp.]